jgi:hypothetical protein
MTWLRNSLSVLGIAALCGLVTPGCEDNASMLFIKGVLAIETTNCVAKPESAGTLRAFGSLDTSLANGYVAALLVGSQLTQRGSREQLRTETARLSLEGAEVTLNDASGNPLDIGTNNPFTTLGTGFVDPASGTSPGFGAIFVDVIPAGVMGGVSTALGGRGVVQAKIRVFGTTLGGQDIESGDYTFSIEVCNGCLIEYANVDDTSGAGDFTCTGPAQSSTKVVCSLGQDQVTPCSLCAGAYDVCLNPCSNCYLRQSSAITCQAAAPASCATP